jgi:voltage-gated sodium channel
MDRLKAFLETKAFERAITTLIVLNAITLGLETSKSVMDQFGTILTAIDKVFLAIFVVELMARIAVYRGKFFRDPWSLFDLFVIVIALLPASGSLSVLRALRVLRVLRLITVIPSLRKVVAGLVSAMPGMGSIGLLLVLVYYVFAVMATKLFGETNPELFGSLGHSAYTLFQLMTFDDWSKGVVEPLAQRGHDWAWVFIIMFMVLSAFMVLNLFIGVVVTALDEVTDAEKAKTLSPGEERLLAEIGALRDEVRALKAERQAASKA